MIRKADDYVEFILIDPSRNYSYAFKEYGDNMGILRYIDKFSKKLITSDMPEYRHDRALEFKWLSSKRKYRTHKSNEDIIKFLREYPHCYKSPLAPEKAPKAFFVIAEINDVEHANKALEVDRYLNEALGKAFRLEDEPEKRKAVATLCGIDVNTLDDAVVSYRLVQFAKDNPQKFIDYCDAPDTNVRGQFLQAISLGIIKRNKFWFDFGDIRLGQSEDKAIQFLIDNPEVQKSIGYQIALATRIPDEDVQPKKSPSKTSK